MSNPHRTERRTLGVRADYLGRRAHNEKRPAWTFAESNLQPGQDRKPRQPAAQGHVSRPPAGEKPPRQWSMPFETRCLLVVTGPVPKDAVGRKLLCTHVRSDGEEIGTLVARMPWGSEMPAAGTRIEAVGLVSTCSNGKHAPLVRLEVARWSQK
ncbi:hypothetical protein ACNRBH_09125 [Ralstonia pseudosolanacearum]|uniref:hypothetical protein n=1 Tax=Ralstonia pseudosolanacearum TaxID=1310165 RepID=UPI002675D178|nr:hypothetical protein [Ralstonia pseudosolanacearum]MDO3527522.1 hypothetical protein [Ralstonia pseudosolanacearum]MDO3531601.1 hypothetical protein [Ralstonia pseudosolanacearum]